MLLALAEPMQLAQRAAQTVLRWIVAKFPATRTAYLAQLLVTAHIHTT